MPIMLPRAAFVHGSPEFNTSTTLWLSSQAFRIFYKFMFNMICCSYIDRATIRNSSNYIQRQLIHKFIEQHTKKAFFTYLTKHYLFIKGQLLNNEKIK